ncbi:MAG: hypothetical protein WCI11_11080 [Candidatus Methylumidiphilus sp.]
MNIRNAALTLGLFLALAIPALGFAGEAPLNSPLVVAKDEAKCDSCIKKLTELCDGEFKVCASKNDAAACQAYYDKCKAGVRARCGGPTMCD